MKNINKKIVSSILLIALIFSSKSINVLASQSDIFDLQTAINEKIVIEQDKDEIEEIENIKSSVLITEDIYQEEDNKAKQKEINDEELTEDTVSTDSEAIIIVDTDVETKPTQNMIFGTVSTESEVDTYLNRKNYGHLDPGVVVPVSKTTEKNIFGLPNLPSSYDAREKKNSSNMSIVPPIRSQGDYGTCWAHSTIGMVETSIRTQDLVDNEEGSNLSEAALAYFVYNLESVTDSNNAPMPNTAGRDYEKIDVALTHEDWSQLGGSPVAASIIMSSYMGVVVENEDTKYEKMADIELNGLDGKYAYHNNDFEIFDSQWINKQNIDLIKQAIMENGSAGISYCEGRNINNCHKNGNEWYYYPESAKSNHDVMIVGWDDNISKELFYNSKGQKPTNDGGWLVRNSWGDTNVYANHGYFWISYEDQTLEENIYSIKAIKADTYKYNYHYDSTGVMYSMSLDKDWAAANMFKVTEDYDQTLDAVNVVLMSANSEFYVDVYTKDTEMQYPLDGTKQISQKVYKDAAGVYTIVLDNKIPLTKGSYFSVLVRNDSDNKLKIVEDGLSNTAGAEVHFYNEAALKQSYMCVPKYGYSQDDNDGGLTNIGGINYGFNYRIKALTNIANNGTGPKEYTLSPYWFDSTKAGKEAKEITSITISKYPTAAPTGTDASYDIDRSDGLKCYVKGTEITIYAPENKTIYAAEDSSYLFSTIDVLNSFVKVSKLKGLNNLDTSKVKNMERMFAGLGFDNMYESMTGWPWPLKTNPQSIALDVSSFDTSNVTNMSLVFEASAIETIDLSHFNTEKVETMNWMFAQCGLLKSLNLSNFDTTALISIEGMFEEAISLTSIDFTNFTLKNVTNFNYLFSNVKSITTLDLSSFDTSNATQMTEMFKGCDNLKTILVSSMFTTTKVASSDNMFNDCTSLIGGKNTSYKNDNPKDKTYAIIDGTNGNPGYFTSVPLKEYILSPSWYNETEIGKTKNQITKITILEFPTIAPTDYDKTWNISSSNGLVGYIKDTEIIIYAPQEGTIFMAENSSYLFSDSESTSAGFSALQEINNLNVLDTTKVINMKSMFDSCANLSSIDVSNFVTDKVTDMSKMFYYCRVLENLDVSKFDTSNVTNFCNMFFSCMYLDTINVAGFDTSKATDLSGMFYNCVSLFSLDTSKFNTSNVTNMSRMFCDCQSLVTIDLSNFDTSKVTDMSQMFYFMNKNNTSLKKLDLRSFDTKEVTSMSQMFYNCKKLETIIASEKFVTTKLTETMSDLFMFEACEKLKGGSDTIYDVNHIDKTYARIDGRSGLPGYFTGTIYYNVSFDMKGHGIKIPTQSVVEKGLATKPVDPTETGYEFKGWYDSDQCTTLFDFNKEITKETILYAKWDKITVYYDVNFYMQGHGTQIPKQSVKEGEKVIIPTAPTETGYEFKGWYDSDKYSKVFDFNQEINKKTDIYAKWNENEYNVIYNRNGGEWKTGAYNKATRSYTESLTLPTDKDIEKVIGTDTYEFAGWWTQDGTTNNQWGAQVITIAANTANDTEVYAKWKSTVSFNANGHGVAPQSVEITGSTQVLLQGMTAQGYTFGGWYDGEKWETSTKVGDASQTVTFTGPKILYAKWTPITYTIKYNTNDGNFPLGIADSFTKTYNEPHTLASPSKTGYKFDGWYSNNTLTTKYNGTTDLSTTQGDTKDIYAKWTPITYKINYDIPTDITATAPAQYEKHYNQNYTPANPTNIATGYRFVSWHTATPFTDANKYVGNTDLSTTENADITLYSKWEVLFTYNANGHGVAPTNEWVEHKNSIMLASPSETTNGYIFDGWFSETTGGVSYGKQGTTYTVNLPTIAYAHWTEKSFEIVYHNIEAKDYVAGYTAPTSRKYSESKTLPKAENVSKIGYSFDGWYDNDGLNGNKIIEAPANFAGKKEYWLKWKEKTYNITLNDNGGSYVSGYEKPSTRKYTESKTLPTNDNIKKKGHILEGWYSFSDYSGTKAIEVPANQDAHFTFYAKWVPADYNVELITNGGTINTGNVTSYTYGKGATLPTDVTKTNNIFKGWWTADGTNGNWGQQVTTIGITDTEDKKYYAKWVESFVVTFKLDGKGTDFTQSVESGEKAIRPTNPTFADQEFIDWYTDNTYQNKYDFDTIINSAGTEIWAKWQATVTHEVSFDITNSGTDIGATPIDIQYIKEGQQATKPKDPTTIGWTFDGWYADNTYQNKYTFNEAVTAPKILYSKWVENEYKINYIVNDGKWADETQVVTKRKYTDNTTLLTTISKKYHSFGGWYESDIYDGTPITSIATKTAKEITIYAKWIPDSNTYTITFNSNYNGATKEEVFLNTEDIALRTDLFSRDGYTFSYWRDADGNKYSSSDVALSGIVLYAEWIQNTPPPSPSNDRDSYSNGTSGNGGSAIPQAQANQQQNQAQNANSQRVDNYQVHTNVIQGEKFVFDPATNKMKISNQNLKAGFYNIDTGTGGAMYCIDENGNMKTGFVEYQGNIYYMDERQANLGRMFVGEVIIDNFKFVFDAFGKCISGKENYQQVLQKQQALQAQQAMMNAQQQNNQQIVNQAQKAQQMAQQAAVQTAMKFAQFNKQNAWNSILNMIGTKPFLIP